MFGDNKLAEIVEKTVAEEVETALRNLGIDKIERLHSPIIIVYDPFLIDDKQVINLVKLKEFKGIPILQLRAPGRGRLLKYGIEIIGVTKKDKGLLEKLIKELKLKGVVKGGGE